MSRARLQHVYSQPAFSDEDYDPRDDEPGRRCWENASMRIVRSRKRMRKLRRRGVEVIDTGERTRTGRTVFAWFVEASQS